MVDKVEEYIDNKAITKLMDKGHPYHCAFRQLYGDGECECDLYKKGYDPYKWMKLSDEEKNDG